MVYDVFNQQYTIINEIASFIPKYLLSMKIKNYDPDIVIPTMSESAIASNALFMVQPL